MSGSAVFSATIDEITSRTSTAATVNNQNRPNFDKEARLASISWSDRTKVSTMIVALFRSAIFETNSLGTETDSLVTRSEGGETMTDGRNDPRPARSRARLLDAATALLRSGGPSAVTVDAVTRAANVARATLYRHFPSGNDLLAAAFHALIPPAPTPPAEGSLRDRLIALVQAQAELIAEAPVTLTAMSWLTLGGDLERLPGAPHRGSPDSPEVRTLRERVAEQYAAPFEAILSSPQAIAELGDVDRTKAAALLLGPIALGKLSTLPDFDYREIAVSAVDGFLATHRKKANGLSAASSE